MVVGRDVLRQDQETMTACNLRRSAGRGAPRSGGGGILRELLRTHEAVALRVRVLALGAPNLRRQQLARLVHRHCKICRNPGRAPPLPSPTLMQSQTSRQPSP